MQYPNVLCLAICADIRPTMRGCTEEEREKLWLSNSVCSEQAERGRHLQLIQLHFCTLIPQGDWGVDHGCCEWHRKALSPVPYLHSPCRPEHKASCYWAPQQRLAPPRLILCAKVLLEPHLPWNTEKDGPAWLGLGKICLLFNRPGLGLALLQYESDDIYYDKPKLCTNILLHRPNPHNY